MTIKPPANPAKKSTKGRKQFDGKDPAIVIPKLEVAWSAGASDVQACLLADISPSALCRYLKSHPAISARKDILLHSPKLNAKLTLATALHARNNPDLALKYLERTEPKEYAPMSKLANTDNEGNMIAPVFSPREGKL